MMYTLDKNGTTRRIVSKRNVKGFWNCKYCGTNKIDGLVDYCPNCGRHKPSGTKHDLDKNNIVEVSKEELAKAGIVHSEDGTKRPEWSCKYCDSMNNWLDNVCHSCGGATKENKEEPKEDVNNIVYDSRRGVYYIEEKPAEEYKEEPRTFVYNPKFDTYYMEEKPAERNYGCNEIIETPFNWKDYIKSRFNKAVNWVIDNIGLLLKLGFAFSIVALIIFLLYPIKDYVTVDKFSWERSIEIEELRTFSESDWSLPTGARLSYQRQEVYDTETVIDHYEKVEVTKSREEIVGYEDVEIIETKREIVDYEIRYEKEYESNEDGTYTEYTVEVKEPVYGTVEYTRTEKEPIYETVYYTEIEEKPVYKEVDIIKTKYYYDIDRWVTDYTCDSYGSDKNPYWNENYTLGNKERVGSKTEYYFIHYNNSSKVPVEYSEWNATNIGDSIVVTKCRLGITYNVEKNTR